MARCQKPIVLVDLDGVLADFRGGALAKHKHESEIDPASWEFWIDMGMTEDEFWWPLRGSRFWAKLPPLDDGIAMFRKIEKALPKKQIGFLTSAIMPGAADGKRQWIDEHLTGYGAHMLTGTEKHLMAAPMKILIDDSHKNTDAWEAFGGHAILVPRPWNRRAKECKDGRFCVMSVMAELRDLLGTIG